MHRVVWELIYFAQSLILISLSIRLVLHFGASFIVFRCDNGVWMVDKYERLGILHDDFRRFLIEKEENICSNLIHCYRFIALWTPNSNGTCKSKQRGEQSETKLLSRWTFMIFIRRKEWKKVEVATWTWTESFLWVAIVSFLLLSTNLIIIAIKMSSDFCLLRPRFNYRWHGN